MKNAGREIVARRPYSRIPGDSHLNIVLADATDKEAAVWTYNTDTKGFGNGEYFLNLDDAIRCFVDRGPIGRTPQLQTLLHDNPFLDVDPIAFYTVPNTHLRDLILTELGRDGVLEHQAAQILVNMSSAYQSDHAHDAMLVKVFARLYGVDLHEAQDALNFHHLSDTELFEA